MTSQTFIFVVLIVAVHFVESQKQIPIVCNQTGAHSDLEVDRWTNELSSISFSSRRLLRLGEIVYNSSKGFTGPQTARLLAQFPFSDGVHQALNILNMYALGMTCDEAAQVIRVYSFSSDRLEALRNIVDLITDLENNQTLVDIFVFTNDQRLARKIIENAVGRSCIYGTITETRVQFLVDVSLSMSATFKASNGEMFNRLTFVQRELDEVIRRQLRPEQSFNVFSFAGTVVAWQPGLVPATSANIDMAVSFVNQMNFRRDGTNSYEALRVALSDPNVEAVYFLTDGQPTVGPSTNTYEIINFVRQWNIRNIPVHSTAFLSGYFNGDDKPAARNFMQQLAEATGGIFRSIE